MKNKVLSIKKENWGLKAPNTWEEIKWTIYDNMTIEYSITYNKTKNRQKNINYKISKNKYKVIINEINEAKKTSKNVEAYDGEAWEFIEYDKEKEIWGKKLGYIYGITPLEKIAKIIEESTNNKR